MFLTEAFFWRLGTGFILLVVALVLVRFFRHAARRATQSRNWPSVQGSVIETSLEVIADSVQWRFRPAVEYAYRVGNKDYRGSRIQWGDRIDLPSRAAAARVIGHYRTGKPVRVYYDPRQPAVAVLQPGHAAGIDNVGIVAPACGAFGLLYLGFAFLG
jgi:hypothetical protein